MTTRTLLLTAAAMVSLGVLSGCTGSGTQEQAASGPADPTQITDVVRKYFDAYNSGDVDGLNATSCSSAQREHTAVPSAESVLASVDEPIVEGDSARVPVELTLVMDGFDPTPSRTQIFLVAEGGRWGVCMFERPAN